MWNQIDLEPGNSYLMLIDILLGFIITTKTPRKPRINGGFVRELILNGGLDRYLHEMLDFDGKCR